MDFEKYFGVTTKTTEELVAELKADIGREFVSRADFNLKNEELKRAQELNNEHAKQLEKLAELEGDKDSLKEQIGELRQKNAETEAEYQQKLMDLKMNTAMDAKLSKVFQSDTIDYIKTLVKKENLTFTEDGNLLGLDEQIEPLKETKKSFLLQDDAKNPTFVKGSGSQVSPSITRAEIEAIKNPVERQKKIAENLDLFT